MVMWKEVSNMPMRRGQTVQRPLQGTEALGVLQRLADENPDMSDVVLELGARILELDDVGLRDRTLTYDVAFVFRKAFATFVTPSYQGSINARNSISGLVSVQVHGVSPEQFAQVEDDLSPWSNGKGLHVIRVRNQGDVESAFRVIQVAYDWAASG